jgi:hypothetical protein
VGAYPLWFSSRHGEVGDYPLWFSARHGGVTILSGSLLDIGESATSLLQIFHTMFHYMAGTCSFLGSTAKRNVFP